MSANHALLLATALLSGCAASITFGEPPARAKPTSPEQRCYQRKELSFVAGRADVEWGDGDTTYRSRTGGLTFYLDGKRLTTSAALRLLGDEPLARAYGERLGELGRARYFYAAVTLFGAGLGLAGVGGLAYSVRNDTSDVLMVSSIAASIVGAATVFYGQSRWARWKGTHQVYGRLFVDDKLIDRLGYALQRFNRGVGKRCGYETLSIPEP